MAKQETKFTGEIGIHYPLHVLNRYSLPELIGLAETAWRTMRQFGFSQVWTNDIWNIAASWRVPRRLSRDCR